MNRPLCLTAFACGALLLLSACGGAGAASPSVTNNLSGPASPGPLRIVTALLNPGIAGQPYTFSLNATGGAVPIQWSIIGGALPPGLRIRPGDVDTHIGTVFGVPSQPGTYSFTVRAQDASVPPQTSDVQTSLSFAPGVLALTDKFIPHAVAGQPYSFHFGFKGGTPPYTWTLTPNPDLLPDGLAFNNGEITGTPAAAAHSHFQVEVTDGTPGIQRASLSFSLLVVPTELPSRNDTIATATPIFRGSYFASLSPYDSLGAANPDHDYYKLTVPAGSFITVSVVALDANLQSTGLPAPLDPVVEIVDGSGTRLSACNDPFDDNPPAGAPIAADLTPGGFDDPCMNNGTQLAKATNAALVLKVPGSGDVTFYIHVFDFRGAARPDMNYLLTAD
jgi:Putative Ig domain